jgi:type IV pilus assembly protein PilY1
MKRSHLSTITRLLAYGLAANLAAQPALAQVTISQLPLASAGGSNILPNLLFTLDNSGSMNWDFNPDYVNPPTSGMANNPCMTDSTGSTNCTVGDPPYTAGGQHAMNGVAYDPDFSYLNGINSTGQPLINAPTGTLTPTAVPNDAYGIQFSGSSNLTTSVQDRRFCNANNVCLRTGQDDTTGNLVSGTDDSGHTLSAGQLPYRTNKSNASANTSVIFGLPEMMQLGSFKRSSLTVTATTVEAHGLTTSDKVYVTSGTSGLNVTCAPVTTVPNANSFTYTSGSSGTINATAASYRKCVAANFVRAGSTVTVTSSNNGLVANDVITTSVSGSAPMTVANVTVTAVTATTFTYTTGSSGTVASTAGFWVRTGLYNVEKTATGPAIAYRIVPVEYCADANLTDCIEVIPPAAAPADHPFPAYVRFCRTQEEALAHGPVTFIATTPQTNRCQLKYINEASLQTYMFPRYGWFVRDTIKSTVLSYSGRPDRIDCAAPPTCTYTEEIQNYSKWYAYYRTRMQMMKTAVGISFRAFISAPTATPPKPDNLRVGLITIHAEDSGSIDTNQYLRINNFNTTQAGNFYTTFYKQNPGNGTPLREALSRAGWIFAGKLNTGLTAGIPTSDDPLQSSCQKNYTLLTTDGFWNGSNDAVDIAGAALGNWDNGLPAGTQPYFYTPPGITPVYTDPVVSRATGTFDGNLLPTTTAGSSPGGSSTLADVALYYYMTDLRGNKDRNNKTTGPSTSPNTTPPNGDVATNNVPSKAGNKDFVEHQHMVTFTLGLADGLMRYDPNYETAPGDFANIKNGVANACFWASGTCNWPVPSANDQTGIDDLWHAAVNGRGLFFQAQNPRALSSALDQALTNIASRTASASAAATSSPNITPKDNFAFSTTYQTNTWSGIVKAQKLDPVSGLPQPTILWQADTQLLTQVAPTADTRSIWMLDTTQATKLKPFLFGSMTAAEQAFFTSKCPTMTQCALLTLPQTAQVNAGTALVNFLRGQTGNEGLLFRDRTETDPVTNATLQTVLGDIVDATPAYVRIPEFNYTDTGYPAFVSANQTRPGALYVAANDGLLHSFDNTVDVNGNPLSTAGKENWAYMPKFVMPGIYQVADTNYANAHRFMLDGSPETGDVFDPVAGVWKTILIGGANSGARGFYALDITDPKNPKGLWEFCSDSTLCPTTGSIVHSDADLGFSYGNPVIGKLSDGKWVVVLTSGLNNTSPGTGAGFFYVLDPITGQVLFKVGTGAGTTGTPLGLMKQAGFYPKGLVDGTFITIYGGDLQGNVWRMDMTAATASVAPTIIHMATLKDASGNTQPITVRPVATNYQTFQIYYVGTGRYLAATDPSDTSQQSIYGFKDKGTDYGTNIRAANLVVQTLSTGSTRTISNNNVNWATNDGFVIDLNPGNTTPGERIVLDPRLELGTLIFASNVPIIGGCTPGGDSFVYNLNFSSGSYVPGTTNGVAGVRQGSFLVGLTPIQTTDGSIRTINTDSGGGLNTGSVNINNNPSVIQRFSYRER